MNRKPRIIYVKFRGLFKQCLLFSSCVADHWYTSQNSMIMVCSENRAGDKAIK